MDPTERETPHLTTLPPEILHSTFQWLYPADLIALPRVCRMLHAFVQGNQPLCRQIYLNSLVGRQPFYT